MFQETKVRFPWLALLCLSLAVCASVVRAQETGGDLVGGAGIFRPKNPEARRSTGPRKPPRPTMTAAESEENTRIIFLTETTRATLASFQWRKPLIVKPSN